MSGLPLTIPYHQPDGLDVNLDIYIPEASGRVPAVLYFHGGGLFCGQRDDLMLPHWLKDAALERGWFFLAADYRLLLPFTSHDQLEDMRALSRFLSSPSLSAHLPSTLSLDSSALFVAGLSAGGYLARQFALFASPKPNAILSVYGAGGDILSDHYIIGHDGAIPFFQAKTEASEVVSYIGSNASPQPSSASALLPAPLGSVCADGRHALFPWAVQKGTLSDYMTGKSGLRARLAGLTTSASRELALDEEDRALFPQIREKELPPTFLIHGDVDTAVPLGESERTYKALLEAGVKTELVVVPEAEHGLLSLKRPGKEAEGSKQAYKRALAFLDGCLAPRSLL